MAQRLQSNLTVSFVTDGDESGNLSAEIDRRPEGLNAGLVNFKVGDSPGFLVYLPTGFKISEVRPTLGSITSVGTTTISVEEWLTFENSRFGRTSKPVASGLTYLETYGDAISGTVVGGGVIAPAPLVAVARVRYNTTVAQYRLTGVGNPVPVIVFIRGVEND